MSIGARRRWRVLSASAFTCNYCGRSAPEVRLEVEHVNPRFRGGSDHDTNLVAACQQCNASKGTYDIEDAVITRDWTKHLLADRDELESYVDALRQDLHELRGVLAEAEDRAAYLEYALDSERSGYRSEPMHIADLLRARPA